MGINDINNYPILAILDPRLVSNAPLKVVISSTLDALVMPLKVSQVLKVILLQKYLLRGYKEYFPFFSKYT